MTARLRDPNEVPFFRGTSAAVDAANAYTDAQIATLGGIYEPLGASAAAVAAHESLLDPHPQYLTHAEGDLRYALPGTAGTLGPESSVRSGSPATQALTPNAYTILDYDTTIYNNATSLYTVETTGRITVASGGIY